MIRNVPLTAVQAAVYKVLRKRISGYNVYDDSTPFEDGELVDSRYLVIGETTGKPSSAKRDCPVWEVTVNINAFSNYHGKKELDEMLDDIVQVLTGSAELEQIEIVGYYFHGLEIDMVEAFKEEYEDGTVWQHGVVRVIVKVEQKEM